MRDTTRSVTLEPKPSVLTRMLCHVGRVSGLTAVALIIGLPSLLYGKEASSIKVESDSALAARTSGSEPNQSELLEEVFNKRYIEQLEFRAILVFGRVERFTLHDPQEWKTYVLTKEEGRNGIEVLAFDSDANSLTVRYREEDYILYLETSRVAAFRAEDELSRAREFRDEWAPPGDDETRREKIEEVQAIWFAAKEESREIREIHEHLGELIDFDRQNRKAMEGMDPASADYEFLRDRDAKMREEFALLSRFAMIEMQRNPAFAGLDFNAFHRGIFRIDPKPGDGRAADGLYGEYVSPFSSAEQPSDAIE